ncbi:endonuclease/exonuclease/phosphatase family protein [Soonwooa sp.]|uniref:endonuclease/exonuclease/phosphatase family protein n=1 Tax=Soonwooa sp. TaxID=1938592 RepID=UPI0026224BCD|nr:endonuclease/exonuclease/phosphatase family protein [Soonwooa sp.]
MKLVNILLTLLHLVIAGLLLAMLCNSFIQPSQISLLNLLSLGFPILMILNVILCIYWIVLFKKRSIFFLLISIMFITPTRRWINYSSEKKDKADFTLMTFNVKHGEFGMENIEKYISEKNPDIILLQEISSKINLPNYLYKIEGFTQTQCFSKYPIEKFEDIKTQVDIGNSFYADINFNGKNIRFVNIYMEPFQIEKQMVRPSKSMDENEAKAKGLIKKMLPVFKEHQTQMQNTMTAVDNSPYPVVFAGDFNAVPNSYEYYLASKNLKDAFLEAGSGSGTSFHDFKFPIKIDHIFTSESIKALNYRVDRSVHISDHYPVLASFKIQ